MAKEIIQKDISSLPESGLQIIGYPNAEVIIVRQNDQAREVYVIPNFTKMRLGSNEQLEIIKKGKEIDKECKETYGPDINFVFVDKKGFTELLQGEDFSELGGFIKKINFSEIPIRVIRVV